MGKYIYNKEHYFYLINDDVLDEITDVCIKLFWRYREVNKPFNKIYLFLFLTLVIDVPSLCVAFKVSSVYKTKGRDFFSYTFICSIFLLWIISIIFIVFNRIRLRNVKNKVKEVIEMRKADLKCLNEDNKIKLFKALCKKGIFIKNNTLEIWVISYILLLIPIVLKIILFKSSSYEKLFIISSVSKIVAR